MFVKDLGHEAARKGEDCETIRLHHPFNAVVGNGDQGNPPPETRLAKMVIQTVMAFACGLA